MKAPLKIAIDIRSTEGRMAGKGNYTYNITKNLLKLDKKNQYILYCENPDLKEWEGENVSVRKIKGKGVFWHLKAFFNIRKENPDIFFAPTSYIIPSLPLSKIKVVSSVHDLVSILFPSKHLKKAVFIEKLLISRMLKNSLKICSVSENTKKDILAKFDIDKNKIEVIYCGVSDSFKPLSDEKIISLRKSNVFPNNFLLALSTIEPRKNFIRLIQAFAVFKVKHPDFKLIIVGQKGWQFDDVFKEVIKCKLKNDVIFPDYLPEDGIINLYNLANAFVFPSLYEGFGIPPLEAMRCNCPVLASNISSIPEVVGDAGLLVDPLSVKDIAEKMAKIVDDKNLNENLRKKGLERSKIFNWENSAKKLLELFEKL